MGSPPFGGLCGMCHWLSPHGTSLLSGHCDTLARTTVLVEYALVFLTRKQGERGLAVRSCGACSQRR